MTDATRNDILICCAEMRDEMRRLVEAATMPRGGVSQAMDALERIAAIATDRRDAIADANNLKILARRIP